jgi:hypothetical protein
MRMQRLHRANLPHTTRNAMVGPHARGIVGADRPSGRKRLASVAAQAREAVAVESLGAERLPGHRRALVVEARSSRLQGYRVTGS